MSYALVKWIHVITVLINIILLMGRGGLSLFHVPWRQWKPLRWLPHANDTVLLLSAIGLCILLGQYPLVHHWLTAMVLATIAYIVLGALALKPNCGALKRVFLLLACFVVFSYISGVARTHNPMSWMALAG
ncbi:MAG: SirB2 family protein [Xanthomonadales bacterium]|nr:SirB2 family protein [Xanthomonadales bacterium]